MVYVLRRVYGIQHFTSSTRRGARGCGSCARAERLYNLQPSGLGTPRGSNGETQPAPTGYASGANRREPPSGGRPGETRGPGRHSGSAAAAAPDEELEGDRTRVVGHARAERNPSERRSAKAAGRSARKPTRAADRAARGSGGGGPAKSASARRDLRSKARPDAQRAPAAPPSKHFIATTDDNPATTGKPRINDAIARSLPVSLLRISVHAP